jgi:5-methylcytosine-specific restriction endonuclease McrA
MHVSLTARQLKAHGGELVLFPGVAHGLARLSGLLKPVIELLWVADVQRLNSHVLSDGPDLAAHLFGRDRVSLAPARAALMDAFGARCFYCDVSVGSSAPVDHVLAWSRVGLDGLSNLVVACARCNGDKSEALPGLELVSRALARDPGLLDQIALALEWPTQRSRVVAAAHGLYRVQPMGTPLWTGVRQVSPLDVNWVPGWLNTISLG